jgi:hypothetical protein
VICAVPTYCTVSDKEGAFSVNYSVYQVPASGSPWNFKISLNDSHHNFGSLQLNLYFLYDRLCIFIFLSS